MQLQAPEEPEQKEDPKASKAKDAKGKKRWADGNEWAMGVQLSAMNAQDVVFMWLVFLQTFVDVWGGEHHHFSIGASLGWWSPIDFHIFAALGWVETYARPPNSGALIKHRFGFGKLSTSSWQARLKVKWEVKLEKREAPKMAGAEVSNNWDICMDSIEERGAISTHRYDPNHGEKNLRYMGVCVCECVCKTSDSPFWLGQWCNPNGSSRYLLLYAKAAKHGGHAMPKSAQLFVFNSVGFADVDVAPWALLILMDKQGSCSCNENGALVTSSTCYDCFFTGSWLA